MKKSKHKNLPTMQQQIHFVDSSLLNDGTFIDYLNRLRKISLSIFEWVNLPKTMDARYLERCLFYNGSASILKDENYGIINTNCTVGGNINIYGLPIDLHCFSYSYNTDRKLYTGITENAIDNTAILVMNDWERIPTSSTIELFAYRLYECERTCDVNIKAQKTPVLILTDDKQKLSLKNLYLQYDGNQPVIYGDKNQIGKDAVSALKTDAPFVCDKIMTYKKQIWNEALTFLGINNILEDKKERLITDEANSNNELINLNLQSYLAPRQLACQQFNELFGLTNEKDKISVRVRSDLKNIIKQAVSVVQDYKEINDVDDIKVEGDENNG